MDLTVAHASQLIVPLVGLPLLSAVAVACVGGRLPRGLVGGTACLAVLGAFSCAAALFAALQAQPELMRLDATVTPWLDVAGLQLPVRLVVDPLSALFALVITGVGSLIHIYSLGYMAHDPGWARYFACLNLFVAAMLLLVLGDSLPLMFVGWEGVGLCSYLLVGFWWRDADKAAAGSKAFLVNRIGDCGFLAAMLLLWRSVGGLSIASLAAAAAAGQIAAPVALAAGLCLLLAASGKSAQVPLYVWLPDAMAGPTPVSALIHAATMVTAGVYMATRMSFLFHLAPVALCTVAVLGTLTAMLGASVGCAVHDIKRVLAYSTISQLGFMFMAVGVGAYSAAVFHVVTHALFKACLFLGAGAVIHALDGEQDVRRMGGLWRRMPLTCASCVTATLCISGLPLTSGYISKDAILGAVFAADSGVYAPAFAGCGRALWLLGTATAGLTAFYMWRVTLLTFFSGAPRSPAAAAAHEAPASMALPLTLLAVLALPAGALGWPEALGGHDWLASWLAPAIGAPLHAATDGHAGLLLMAVSAAVALAGSGVALLCFARAPRPEPTAGPSWLRARLQGQWHVDALYDAIVVRPWLFTARTLLGQGVERYGIEGATRGTGWALRSLGFCGQLLQSGNIQRYLAVFTLGVAAVLYWWLTPAGGHRLQPASGAAARALLGALR